MATTDQIDQAARDLGKLIAEHPAAAEFDAASKALAEDAEAEQLINDFNSQLQTLTQKQRQGQTIEVDEKRKLQELQNAVASNPLITRVQKAQMDYADLLRRVTDTITRQSQPEHTPPTGPSGTGASPTGA